ncbi:serine/threonine-protein kinase [Paractinoplanes rishiriensis]|uniref:non-specific serine/threonine protein kinase n=1 Tax=Paractinoplanes rishiriensis TaxID=1050105 RepID=A0A919JTA5_9ACTN|nr:serine/threonine-protein kinase [Actinoplanes rishiriensis]GIE92982.1 hypothetical protein Ari01nite_04470 [Actinoplanes rishiriensis]
MTKDRTSSVARADSDGASTMDLSGRCVGSSYILQHPIGQGATGTVWRGLDRSTGEPVAVKLLHESLLRQPKLVTRFVQERTILLMLRHRNVVRVRDLFSVGETLGLVMDLVDGGSLRDHLREHDTVPAGEAARLACQVAAALAEAHELGVIHRDLKPDNILLHLENGRLDTRLTDFGVARILNTPSMTTPNAVVGTPHYMAPEAFHGTTASPATDVYALGVLLYELVTGRPPYDSDSIPDLMRRHMEGNPPRPPGVPEPVWDVIMDCMATKPRLRPSAAELVVSLADLARECAGTRALPAPQRPAPDFSLADVSRVLPPPVPRQAAPDNAAPNSAAPNSAAPNSAALGMAGSEPGRSGRAGSGRAGSGADGVGRAGLGRAGSEPSGSGRGTGRPLDAGGHGDEPDPVSIVPLPRAADPRGNAAPGWRWARPGATLIAAAMLASAVATTAWHFGRAENDAPDTMTTAPQVLAASSPAQLPQRGTAGKRVPQRAVASSTGAPRQLGGTGDAVKTARSAAASRVPDKATRPPQPEAKPYGPWQCTQRFAFDLTSKMAMATKPCQMLGRDIQYQGSLTAPGGGTGSITVTVQDAATGRTVAGPRTCDDLTFGGDASTRSCGPATARPERGRQYTVVMAFRYQRDGRAMSGTAKGSAFAW